MTIRQADKKDIPSISALAHVIWPPTYERILSAPQIRYMLDLFYSPRSLEEQFDRKHIFLLALTDDETVAFASYSDSSRMRTCKVHKLYVHPQLQGKGVGRKLLDRIASNARSTGASSLELNVNRHNPAKAFYTRYGFHISGEEDIDIGEGHFMNDYIMQMDI